jgi:hypothetical protein
MGNTNDDERGERPRNTEPDLESGTARKTLDDVENVSPATEGQRPVDVEHAGDDEPEADGPHAPAGTEPQKPKPALFIILGTVIFVALAGPVLFYFFIWRYKPTAPQHIPSGTNLAVRIDAKELYLYAPFRNNVLSVLEDQPGVKSRASRLKKLTGIDLRSDLREIVIASPDGVRFVVLLGGYFTQARMSRANVTKGLLDFFAEEGIPGFSLEGEVLKGPGGLEIGQAEDTTVIIASDDDMLKASLQPSDDWMSLGLVSSGAMSFVVETPAFEHAAKTLSGFGDTSILAHTKRATAFMKLGGSPELDAELVPDGVDSEVYAKEVETALANAKLLTMLLPDVFGEQGALAAARVKPRAQSVMVTAPWPADRLEAGTKRLGDAGRILLEKP